MKRAIVAAVLGVATVATSYAQGTFKFNSYQTSKPMVTFDAGAPGSGFTAGLYWAAGFDVAYSDATGFAIPGSPFALATGQFVTAAQMDAAGYPGLFQAAGLTAIDGTTAGEQVSLIMVVYSGADYAGSLWRGHSAAFNITLGGGTTLPQGFGDSSPANFAVHAVPEPATFALVGLASAALLIIRRRRA